VVEYPVHDLYTWHDAVSHVNSHEMDNSHTVKNRHKYTKAKAFLVRHCHKTGRVFFHFT